MKNQPAFPEPWMPRSGMNLRDYFAAAALTGLMENAGAFHDKEIAKWAYEFADEMLKAREPQEALT